MAIFRLDVANDGIQGDQEGRRGRTEGERGEGEVSDSEHGKGRPKALQIPCRSLTR